MIVSIQKATELTGVSRSTIQRHIKQGKLSRTDKGIDTAELLRVYGELKNTAEQVKINQDDISLNSREQALLSQIEFLTKQLELANKREERFMVLLEKQNTGLFSRLFR